MLKTTDGKWFDEAASKKFSIGNDVIVYFTRKGSYVIHEIDSQDNDLYRVYLRSDVKNLIENFVRDLPESSKIRCISNLKKTGSEIEFIQKYVIDPMVAEYFDADEEI